MNLKWFSMPVLIGSTIASATNYRIDHQNFDFIAPTASNAANVPQKEVGMIILDASTNTFKGLNINGSWVNLSESERTTRVRFGGPTEFTSCTTPSCSIHSQNSAWVSSVTKDNANLYSININPGVFSERPTCTCSSTDPGVNQQSCSIAAQGDSTEISLSATPAVGGSPGTGYFEVICTGPR